VRELTTVDEHPATKDTGDGLTELGAALSPAVVEQVRNLIARVVKNVGTVVRGKPEAVELCLIALLAEGHLMLEDFPGVGKTLLAKSLARSIDCRFSRIQFTPDLLPSDVTGVSIFNQKTAEFEFRGGPIFANIVLADEINRASPKTQSSLLECMQEHQATIDRATYPIERPFMVIGTENPIEYEGTYPLPEAQLDRFMLRLSLGYPSHEEEMLLLAEQTGGDPLESLVPVVSANQVLGMIKAARRVAAASPIRRYVVDLLTATRADADLYLGASPRAGVALLRAAKAQALLRGRDYVVPQDIKDLACHVLCHRVIPSPDAKLHGRTAEHIVRRLLDTVPVPIS
jgi:MoxR-like ATPase